MPRISEARLKTILREAKDATTKKSHTLLRGLDILMNYKTKQAAPPKKTPRVSVNVMKRLLEVPEHRWSLDLRHAASLLNRGSGTDARPRPSEEWIHAQFIQWVKQSEVTIPDLKYLYHPANGGLRNVLVAILFKLLGVRRGTPDIHWPLPRGDYTALWIEFKRIGEKPTAEQTGWHDWLRNNGAFVTVLTDWHTARDTVLWYYHLK